MSVDIKPNPSAAGGSTTGMLEYKGSYNATANTPDLTSSEKGDFYIVSVAGTLATISLDVGDHIVFNQDASSPITSAMFDKIDNTDAVASVNGETGVVVLDTDDVSEGAINQYYTNARFDTRFAAKNTGDLSEGSNLYYTNARFDTQLGTKTTDNLTEGSNLYYTNARADARIAAANMTDLNDVNYTAGAGIDGQFLKYVDANNRWEAAAAPASSDTLDDVVGRGATTATAIQTGGLTVTGDIDPNADATYNIGDENTRFISYYGDMNGAIRFKAKVDQAGGLDAGEVVYIKGVSGTVPTVGKAQANSSSTMPAFGLVFADANDTADVEIITFGNLGGLDTSLLTLNSTLYVSATTAGGLVESAPSGESNLIQNIGFVVRSDNGSGIIKVGGAGRTNATPNLNQDKIFLGNASNQAVATALSSVNLSSLNNDLDTGDISEGSNLYYTNARADARIGAADMTDLSDVNYTAGAGIDGKFLKYVDANNRWEAADAPSAPVSSVNTQTGAVVLDTGDISEGSNLYYTNARADARIGAANLTDLNDVNYTAGSSIDGYVLEYVHANTRWEAKAASGGGFSYTAITSASSPVTATVSTHYGADSSGGAITFNLPALSGLTGGEEIRIKLNTAGNNLTLTANGADTIEGSGSTYVMSIAKESVTCVASSGTNWEII